MFILNIEKQKLEVEKFTWGICIIYLTLARKI